jgi:hypothetical protein
MTKRLSEQLADLSVRAKSAEQALDSAEKETTRSWQERNRRTPRRPRRSKR